MAVFVRIVPSLFLNVTKLTAIRNFEFDFARKFFHRKISLAA